MPSSFSGPPFGVTHPLGLPRPLDPENFFGAKMLYFALNVMPAPNGCLAHFDTAVYRPYAGRIVSGLNKLEFGWSGPVLSEDPVRYCLLRDGIPAEVPSDLWPLLPDPPRVTLAEVLRHFDRHHASAVPMQLLDILTLVSEDLGASKFNALTHRHPWVAEFMR